MLQLSEWSTIVLAAKVRGLTVNFILIFLEV